MVKNLLAIAGLLWGHLNILGADVAVRLSDSSEGFALFRSDTKILEVESILFDFTRPDSVRPVDISAKQISLLAWYTWISPQGTEEVVQQVDTLRIQIEPNFIRVYAEPKWARNVQLILKDLGGAYYGLQETLYPDNKKSPNLRQATVEVEVSGEAYRYHENYASVYSAFFFNTNGYASFFDSFAAGKYQLAQNGKTVITHYTGKLDWYIFTGDYKTIYRDYYAVIGTPKYVPTWACGPVIWRDENQGSEEILNDVQRFTELKIPFTSLFVDRPYSNGKNGWSAMDFSKEFADPGQWIGKLNDYYGVEFMTWIASATFGDQDFPGLLAGHFGYLDLTNPDAVREFQQRLEANQYTYGVKGHKLDRADEHFPLAERWADGTDVYSRQNRYPYLYARVTDSLLNNTWAGDNANFARAAYHRSQPFLTAVWGGDVRTSWDGLASNIANAMRCSFMGFPNWGTDGGGYLGEGYISEELYARWLQFGLWTGFYEVKLDGSGGRGRERTPWQYDAKFQQLYARIFSERMAFVPYIYSMLNSGGESGPLMKPMAMVYPEEERFRECWDQYLFGDAFLVAPIYTQDSKRHVELPVGEWIDYTTGEKFTGGGAIEVSKSLEEYPVFMKAGSIFVKGQTTSGNRKLWEERENYVDVHFVPGSGCDFDFVETSSLSRYHIAAKKLDEKKYQVDIDENPLFRRLYVPGAKIKSVSKNGKRVEVQELDTTPGYIENVAGSTLLLEIY